jgi:K+-sensing histidine kinase KdpD
MGAARRPLPPPGRDAGHREHGDDDGVIAIRDHGEGVLPERHEMIFEPSWRKSEATPGVWPRLAVAKKIMDLRGGRIWVEKTPEGGAAFKLSF